MTNALSMFISELKFFTSSFKVKIFNFAILFNENIMDVEIVIVSYSGLFNDFDGKNIILLCK